MRRVSSNPSLPVANAHSASSGLEVGAGVQQSPTGPLNGLGSRPASPTHAQAPQKPFNFAGLPAELQIPVANALNGKDRFSFAVASKASNAAASDALASERAVHQIKTQPLTDFAQLNNALQIANRVSVDLRHEPLQAVADRLVFLPRGDWQAGKDAFLQHGQKFVEDGNKIDQALKFLDWAMSAETSNRPNFQNNRLLKY